MNYYVVGCGGVGGWLIQYLARRVKNIKDTITLIDGDTVEDHNLDRQLFTKDHIGMPKVETFGPMFTFGGKVSFVHNYLDPDYILEKPATIFVAVDNHVARKAALFLTDQVRGICIIGANETEDSEAYYYQFDWKNSALDPRIYYPDILTNTDDDPLHPPCTGEVQERFPQLALANMNAASDMAWLHHIWTVTAPELTAESAFNALTVRTRNYGSGRRFCDSVSSFSEPQE